MSRGRMVAFLVVALILVGGFFFWRDLTLPRTLTSVKLPDIVVENLDFRRTIDGKDWHIVAKTAEHDSGLINAKDMTVFIREPQTERSTLMFADAGEFVQESSNIELRSLDGFVFTDRSIDISAPLARYDSSTDLWSFEEGIEMQDEETFITGKKATITTEGIFILEEEAYARWKIDQ